MSLPQAASRREGADVHFLTILADGLFHMNVPEGTEGAVIREAKNSKTGEVKMKTELVYDKITGVPTAFNLKTGEYGEQLYFGVGDVVMCVGVNTVFGEDFMQKLPNIDLAKEVTVAPYDFMGKDTKGAEKRMRGLSITQEGEKVKSYFYDAETKKAINDIPAPTIPKGKTWFDLSDTSKKVFFAQKSEFLVENSKKYIFLPKGFVEASERPKYDSAAADKTVEELAF